MIFASSSEETLNITAGYGGYVVLYTLHGRINQNHFAGIGIAFPYPDANSDVFYQSIHQRIAYYVHVRWRVCGRHFEPRLHLSGVQPFVRSCDWWYGTVGIDVIVVSFCRSDAVILSPYFDGCESYRWRLINISEASCLR